MITVWDVLEGNRIETTYEFSIIMWWNYTLISIIGLIILIVYTLIKDGIIGTISMFTDIDNGVTIALMCWILCLIGMFLRGYCYLQRMNKAIHNGTHFKGIIIKKKMWTTATPVKCIREKFWVQLDNNEIVKTPTYVYVPDAYNKCDVYFYRKKYYFTEFRWGKVNEQI